MAFDRNEYDKTFAANIKDLAKAEKVTKQILMELSRSVLVAFHETQDVRYINELVAVLTPVNKKVAVLYFTEFSGFRVEGNTFTKKDKQAYDKAAAASTAFLEDPLNNIWSWAEKEVDISPKEFDINMVTKTIERLNKKAEDAGMSQADVLRAVFKAGFDVDALMLVMGELTNKPKAEEQPA